MSRVKKAFIAAAMVALGTGSGAQASTVLDLAPTFADVYVGSIAISYTVSGNRGVFTAKSTNANGTYKPDNTPLHWQAISRSAAQGLLFDLSVAINTLTGQFIPNDAADYLYIKSNTQTYVSSTGVTDFVMQGNDIFGIGFAQQSGILAGIGRKIVVQLNDPTGISQSGHTINNVSSLSMNTGFAGNSAGYVDNFAVAVPLPRDVWMTLAGLAAVGGMKLVSRRREVLAGK